jgi:hypothetical protein
MGSANDRNARKLVQILAQSSPSGELCEDLRRSYENQVGLKNAVFYVALAEAKRRQWITGGGLGQPYQLAVDGSWKEALEPPSVRAGPERERLAAVVDIQAEKIEKLQARNRSLVGTRRAIVAGETAGSTVATLVQLMVNSSLPLRRRISAAQLLLGFKSPPDVAEHTKQFLHSIFLDQEMDISHRLECAELLRRAEDVRLAPSVERPTVAVVYDTPEQIAERSRQHRAHIEEQARLNAIELAEEQKRYSISK